MKMHVKTWLWYGLAVLIIAVDQISKRVISDNMDLGSSVTFTSFFKFTLLHNHGAAFSFLSDASGWQRYFLGILAVSVSIGLIVWLARIPKQKLWEPIALALVLGGALGNLYDRVALGYVVDFIVVHYQDYYWPAFNVADMGISCGAVMLVIDALRSKAHLPARGSETLDKQ